MLGLWVARNAGASRRIDRHTAGDEIAIERATLVDEITDELAAIDSVETLEGTLAAIRRQRRTDPATTGTDDDATE